MEEKGTCVGSGFKYLERFLYVIFFLARKLEGLLFLGRGESLVASRSLKGGNKP